MTWPHNDEVRAAELRRKGAERSRRRNGPAGGLIEVTCPSCQQPSALPRRELGRGGGTCPYCQAPQPPAAA